MGVPAQRVYVLTFGIGFALAAALAPLGLLGSRLIFGHLFVVAGVALGNTVNGKGGGAIEQLSDQRTDLFFVAPRRRSASLGTQ